MRRIGIVLICLAATVSGATADTIVAAFTVGNGAWFAMGDQPPFGLPAQPVLKGSITFNSTTDAFLGINYTTGNKVWTVSDITTGPLSSLNFVYYSPSNPQSLLFSLFFNYSRPTLNGNLNVLASNNAASIINATGQIACNGCVTVTSITNLSTSRQALLNFAGGTGIGTAVNLPTTPVSTIIAPIGGGIPANFYRFYWPGGWFNASASVTGPELSTADFYLLELFANTGPTHFSTPLDPSDSFTGSFADFSPAGVYLDPGLYSIGVEGLNVTDPTMTINFETPVVGDVPEASSWTMIVLGFCCVGLLSYRRENTSISAAARRHHPQSV